MGFSGETPRRYIVNWPSPAVGQEFTIFPNMSGAFRILNILWTLTTSAVVATRATGLTVDDGTTVCWIDIPPNSQAASSVAIYQGIPQATPGGPLGGLVTVALPPDGLYLPRGWRLKSFSANLDVGDQYSNIRLLVQELPDGPDGAYVPSMPLDFIPADD